MGIPDGDVRSVALLVPVRRPFRAGAARRRRGHTPAPAICGASAARASATSSALPMNSGVRWCSSVRHDIEYRRDAVDGRAAGLLGDERQRVRLVQQAELAARTLPVGGIREQAATQQIAMEIRDERPDVSHAQAACARPRVRGIAA